MGDLIAILSRYGYEFRHRGGENYEGACPRCGGNDRVQIFLQGDATFSEPHWFCRQKDGCGQCKRGHGDLPFFLMEFGREILGHEVRYPEACEILGERCRQDGGANFQKTTKKAADFSKPMPEQYPNEKWMAEAEKLTAWAEKQLWQSEEGQAYLAQRFIEPATARAFRLGWVPKKFYPEREAWGLDPVTKPDGSQKKIWISNGLLIPTLRQCGVVAITIRRNDFKKGDEAPKICQVASGVHALYIMAGKIGQPLVIVEGPLDALLVWQESKGTVAALSPIGTTKTLKYLPEEVVRMIKGAPLAFLMLDNDAGREDAKQDTGLISSEPWLKRFPRLIMHRTPSAKDPGDYIAAGGDFKGFLAYGIQKNFHRVYEIDGRTTCSAAIAALTGEAVEASEGEDRADHDEPPAPMEPTAKTESSLDGQVPMVEFTTPESVRAVRCGSPLENLTSFYGGVSLQAYPDGRVIVRDPKMRDGLTQYVAAYQAEIWKELTCGAEATA